MSTSKTGKHGHAKVHMVALDIFTGEEGSVEYLTCTNSEFIIFILIFASVCQDT